MTIPVALFHRIIIGGGPYLVKKNLFLLEVWIGRIGETGVREGCNTHLKIFVS